MIIIKMNKDDGKDDFNNSSIVMKNISIIDIMLMMMIMMKVIQ